MDEPTAALSHKEIEDLFVLVELLKQDGKAVLFISHKFDEIYRIADRYTVFRDGEMVGKGLIKETQPDRHHQADGRPQCRSHLPRRDRRRSARRCSRSKTSATPPSSTASASRCMRGEILGFYGLVGAGRSEIMQALFGLTEAIARLDHARWQAAELDVARRRDRSGHRLCARGARQAGRRRRPADLPERRSAFAEEDRPQRLPATGRRVRADPRIHPAARPARRIAQPECRHAVGRQPAEGGDRQVARHAAPRHHSR